MFKWVLLLAVLSVMVTVGLLWSSTVPLGVPGEWVWSRIDFSDVWDASQREDLLLSVGIAVIAAAVYVSLARLAMRQLQSAGRVRAAAWLLVLLLAGNVLVFCLQEAPPEGHRLSKKLFVMYYPSTSGYFFEAAQRMESVPEFLQSYERRISQGPQQERILHVGTHPPGLFLLHRAGLELTQHFPNLTRLLLDGRPESVEAASGVLYRNELRGGRPVSDSVAAALWLSMLLTQAIGVSAIWPLYLLLRRSCDRSVAIAVAAWWPLIPALSVFLPKSDALFPAIALSALWCWWQAWDRRSVLWAMASGIVCWAGMFLSLAFLPVMAAMAIATLLNCGLFGRVTTTGRSDRLKGQFSRPGLWLLILVFAGFIGFAVPTLGLWQQFDLNLPVVWWQNYQNHAEFYDVNSRTPFAWILVNPLEALIAVGGPVAMVMLASLPMSWRLTGGHDVSSVAQVREQRLRADWLGGVCIGLLLWFSGKNQGEAARLWLIFYPWAFFAAALTASVWSRRSRRGWNRGWLAITCLQLLALFATVLRVTGFTVTGGGN